MFHSSCKQNLNIFQTLNCVPVFVSNNFAAIGRVQVSKPISRGAAVIGLLLFLLGIALLVSGILLHKKDVNDDIDASEPKLYGLWSAPGVSFITAYIVSCNPCNISLENYIMQNLP